jgi:outer membrane protein assembly factor BamE
MRNFIIIPLIFISILLSACGSAVPKMKPFKMEIQQGNVVTSKMLLQLRPGMTKSQVKFIMGTPLIIDSFHSNRWDYFYQMRQSGKVTEQRRVILDFEKELLTRVRGDVVPQGTPGAEAAQEGNTYASAKSVNPTPVKQQGILDKLKFWKTDESAALNNAANAKKTKDDRGLFESFMFWEKDEVEAAKEAATESGAVAKTAAQATPSLLAVPIAGAAAVEATTAEAPVVEPQAEKSIIATPIIPEPVAPESKPIEPAPEPAKIEVETPKAETLIPEVVAPVVEAPAEKSIIATPVIAEPVAPESKPIEPPPEPAKIEVEAPKVETPKAETLAPEVVAPVIAAPAIEAIAESAPASEPATGLAKDEPFIFRMDKKLNLKNLEVAPAIEINTSSKLKKVDTPPPPADEDPGYLERILEKIGF